MQTNTLLLTESRIGTFLFKNTKLSWLYLILRVYVGWTWLTAGWEKLGSPAWTGDKAGAAIHGFVTGALSKTSGAHPDVQSWYASFLRNFVDNNTVFFSYLVTYGEILVGIGLILGCLTALAAFFGAFMNANFLFAGTVSLNPPLLILSIFIIAAWRTAGWLGLDRWILPKILKYKTSS